MEVTRAEFEAHVKDKNDALALITTKLDRIEQKLNKLDVIDEKIVRLEARMKLQEDKGEAIAVYEERLQNHMQVDEKEQKEIEERQKNIEKKLDALNQKVWIGIGILTMISLLWPYFAPKLFN